MHINCRQFVTKMHQIAPNCVSNVKKFFQGNTPAPPSWVGGVPSPESSPARRFAPRFVAFGHSMSVPALLYE